MNQAAVMSCVICAGCVCLISLVSSHLYKKDSAISSELMSFVSFAPGFFYGVFALSNLPMHLNAATLAALFVKNIFYCLSFYLRYESLRKFGPFVGALMLGTQPVVIFLFGLIFLGESLSYNQEISMILVAAALFLLASGRNVSVENRIGAADFCMYYVFPTVASALAIVCDRFFLKGRLPSDEFFVFDRLLIIPAFLFVLALIAVRKNGFAMTRNYSKYYSIFARNWKALALVASLFTVSVYTYNLALALEKAALVGLFRNAAYPVAAFAGAFLFRHKTSTREWLSLSLIVLAVFWGAFGVI